MKKFKFRKIQFKKVNIHELDDRTLLVNLYITQAMTLCIGTALLLFQPKRTLLESFSLDHPYSLLIWGIGYAIIVIILDLGVSRIVPEEVTDDGGVNDRIFMNRSLLHIALISIVAAVCEEILFRGALQNILGNYWTSILFTAIHIRYLKHWIMTALVFSISYGLGWIYIKTGTLWTPILAHFVIDFVMGCLIRYRRKP